MCFFVVIFLADDIPSLIESAQVENMYFQKNMRVFFYILNYYLRIQLLYALLHVAPGQETLTARLEGRELEDASDFKLPLTV